MAQLLDLPLFGDPALQGYWRLENVNDSSVNGYNLTNNNSVTFTTGKYSAAGNFVAASSQYLSIARASCPNIRISGSQTWVCWVNQTTISSYQAPMRMANAGGGNDAGFLTSADTGNIVYFDLAGLTTNSQVNSGSLVLATGAWYHLAGVYNSVTTTLKIYINGAEGGSVTASGSKTDIASGGFALGARGDAAVFMNGSVDDAAIFSRALTATEIMTLFLETQRDDMAYFM
jgi:hypothetical protein